MASIFKPNDAAIAATTPPPVPVPISTTTPNLGLTKPTIGADTDDWGEMLNTDLDLIDQKVATITAMNSANAAQDAVIATKASTAYVDAADASLGTAIAGKVAKTGDTMTGDLEIQKTLPSFSLHTPGSLIWKYYINTGDGGVQNHADRWIWYSNNTDFFVPGNLVAYWSDARLKEEVFDLSGYEERIMDLRPVSFAWNAKGRELTNKAEGEREIGFIAQEVQSVSAQYVAKNLTSVEEGEEPYLTVKKDEMIADLVALVQSLTLRVRELEDKVNA